MFNNHIDSNGFFKIFVRCDCEEFEIQVKKDYTINRLIGIIQEKMKINIGFSTRMYLRLPHKRYMTFINDLNETLKDYRIIPFSIIYFIKEKDRGGGGYGLNIIDISRNNTKIIEIDDKAPSYRVVTPGLGVQAFCGNDCEAKNKIVYCSLGFVRDYDILQHLSEIKCPSCKKVVYPKNFGFIYCKYAVYYEKWENGKKYTGDVSGKAEKEFILFDEYSSGNANFIRIVFDVCDLNEDI